jgi:hypothetical protein
VVDVGSPVDSIITDSLLNFTDADKACSIMEPTNNRYWLYLNGTIYVLSYYPQLKVQAWSTYLPTYDVGGVQTTFVPEKFLIYKGQIYVLATDGKIFLYGGPTNNQYDGCVCKVELPWLDNKKPYIKKIGERVNVAMGGMWEVQCGLDPRATDPMQIVVPFDNPIPGTPDEKKDSTFDDGSYPFTSSGTHFKFFAQTSPQWKQEAKMSSLTLQYTEGENE